jgi:hypothetical protein
MICTTTTSMNKKGPSYRIPDHEVHQTYLQAKTMKEVRMECLRTPCVVSSNPLASMARTLLVRADAQIYLLGNFITDAIVRPSHGQPSGHCPHPRPSVRPFVRPRPSA